MPDISPELAARIEQLKSSHKENPARFFMPLASAYREAGDLGRAEELLRENLKRHPGYLSAHVLLGRCLADRGSLGEARNEFGYVLSIDPQNLIALRTLGEMAAATGNPDEARRWYGELLSVDPMSVEARQALDALEAAPPAPAAAPAREEAGGWDPFAHGDVASPDAVASAHDEPAFDAPAYGDTRIDESELMDAPGFGDAGLADFGGDEPPRLEPAPELGFGSVDLPPSSDAGGWGDISLDAPADSLSAPAPSEALEFGSVELNDGWNDAPAPSAGDAAGWGMIEDEAPAEPLELRSFHEEDAGEDDVEMVTETMAELYYRQGFVDRAADVYRELITRRGEEPALIGRLAELETELHAARAAEEEQPALTPAPELSSSWLDEVDAAMGVGVPAQLASFGSDEEEVPSESAAPAAAKDDAFADSFADGFGGATLDTANVAAQRDAWSAPVVESTAPVDVFDSEPTFDAEPAYADEPAYSPEPIAFDARPAFDAEPAFDAQPAFDAEPAFDAQPAFDAEPAFDAQPAFDAEPAYDTRPAETSFAAEPSFVVEEPADQGAETLRATHRSTDGTESVATYLWSVLSWRPAQAAVAARETESASDVEPAAAVPLEYQAPEIEPELTVQDAGAPPPPEPWDDQTLGAPEQQPPLDEPWMADAPAAELLHSTSDDEPWALSATPTEELLPDDVQSPVDELPWLAEEPSVDDLAPVGTEDAAATADEPMPWEMALDLPAADAPPATPAPAEPVAGFSFEDFFSDPAPAAAPEPVPAPEPQPVVPPQAPAADAPGGEDDEDLESFQAWLQSLKR